MIVEGKKTERVTVDIDPRHAAKALVEAIQKAHDVLDRYVDDDGHLCEDYNCGPGRPITTVIDKATSEQKRALKVCKEFMLLVRETKL